MGEEVDEQGGERGVHGGAEQEIAIGLFALVAPRLRRCDLPAQPQSDEHLHDLRTRDPHRRPSRQSPVVIEA